MKYGWTWIDSSDEEGVEWIQIGPLDSDGYVDDEMAVIVCRNAAQVRVEHPEWIAEKEQDAQTIVEALNA